MRCAGPAREVGGTNDVTVSNRVNLVDPAKESELRKSPYLIDSPRCLLR